MQSPETASYSDRVYFAGTTLKMIVRKFVIAGEWMQQPSR